MSQNIRIIDPDVFTDPQGAKELQANALRESLSYDAYGSQTEFEVIVLTKPVPMAPSDAQAVFGADSNLNRFQQMEMGSDRSTVRTQGSISFKGRIVGNGFISPHASLPNPCNLDMATSLGTTLKVINMHTTFISVANYSGRLPNIGDTVKVSLQSGDIKFNLQYAIFTKISNSLNGSAVANVLATGCATLSSKFTSFDPDTDLEGFAIAYADNADEGSPNGITYAQAEPMIEATLASLIRDPSIIGFSPLEDGFCGIPTGYEPSSMTAEQAALYAPARCETRTIGRTRGNQPASLTGHPAFLDTLEKIYNAAKKESWWKEHVEEFGVDPICFRNPYRSISSQIYLRMKNCGHRTFEAIMSSPTRARCNPPTARPGRSRHQMGLAIDFDGSIGATSKKADGSRDNLEPGVSSKANVWLTSKGLSGDKTFNIKRYSAESWHWSVDGH